MTEIEFLGFMIAVLIFVIVCGDLVDWIRFSKARKQIENDILDYEFDRGFEYGVNNCIRRVEAMQAEAKEEMLWSVDCVCEKVLKELRKELEE